jgi:hypothetical protein
MGSDLVAVRFGRHRFGGDQDLTMMRGAFAPAVWQSGSGGMTPACPRSGPYGPHLGAVGRPTCSSMEIPRDGGPGEVEAGWRGQSSSCWSATVQFTGPLGSRPDPLKTSVPLQGFMGQLGMAGPI